MPDGHRRRALWTPRVWPGGVLLAGELVGTWRRAEAESLPLPGVQGRIRVGWENEAE